MRHITSVFLSLALLSIFVSCGDKEQPAPAIIDVESVSLDRNTLSLNVGEADALQATVKPDNATYKTVAWLSNNKSVVTVDSEGKVVAVTEGRAIITAKVGVHSATCEVTVLHRIIPVESITLNKTETTIVVGQSETLTATVLPEDAENPVVAWSSSNKEVAVVDEGVVTAIAEGSAIITATAEGHSASCLVTVSNKVIAVESVSLDVTSSTLYVGETLTLTATIHPDEATDKTVIWSSSDNALASVENGKVKALSAGTAIITAKTRDGGHKASCTIEVRQKAIEGGLEGLTEYEPQVF